MYLNNYPTQDPVHIMIDLETWDTTSTAVILSIGAVVIGAPDQECPQFYLEVDPRTQYMRTKSVDTMAWWEKQGNCPCDGTTSLVDALFKLREYLASITARPIIWCRGADFDTAILAHAYRQLGTETPWKYNDVRDFRTVKKMFGESMIVTIENFKPHNALEDAIFQARQLQALGLELK